MDAERSDSTGIRAEHPGIGRMTVFRMLDVLVKLGIVDRLTFPDGTECYTVGCGTHQYAKCESCHKVVELDLALQSDLLDAAAQQSGFMPLGQRIEIDGWCEDCQKEQGERALKRRFFSPGYGAQRGAHSHKDFHTDQPT